MAVLDASLDHRKRAVPAPASLSIAAVADQVGEVELPDPVVLAPGLADALAEVVDPRKPRGVRHRLVVVLTAAVCAVAAGARSFVAVAEWVADLPAEAAVALGYRRRCPSESTIRRVIARVDADRFDAVIGGFVQRTVHGADRSGGAGCSRWTARPCAARAQRIRRASPASVRGDRSARAGRARAGQRRRQDQRADRQLRRAREGGKLRRGRSGRHRVILVRVSP